VGAVAEDGQLHQLVLGGVGVAGDAVQRRHRRQGLGTGRRCQIAPLQLAHDLADDGRHGRRQRLAVVQGAVREEGAALRHVRAPGVRPESVQQQVGRHR